MIQNIKICILVKCWESKLWQTNKDVNDMELWILCINFSIKRNSPLRILSRNKYNKFLWQSQPANKKSEAPNAFRNAKMFCVFLTLYSILLGMIMIPFHSSYCSETPPKENLPQKSLTGIIRSTSFFN